MAGTAAAAAGVGGTAGAGVLVAGVALVDAAGVGLGCKEVSRSLCR